MPVFGLNSGIVSIIAYNYGARKPDRIKKAIQLSVIYSFSIMLLGVLLFEFIPTQLLHMFDASNELLKIGVPAFRYISPSFIFAGLSIIAVGVFQALGKGLLSMMLSFVRQLIFLLPLAYLFSLSGNLDLVWLSLPISEIIACILAYISLKRIYRYIINPLVVKQGVEMNQILNSQKH